jgi:hypothetical protein
MAFEIIRDSFPGLAASAVQDRQVVGRASGTDRGVVPLATCNIAPFGITEAASRGQGDGVTVYEKSSYCKAVAAASIGRNAELGVVGATRSLGPVAGASGSVVWSAGQTVTAAAAGEVVTFYVNPRQLSGLS